MSNNFEVIFDYNHQKTPIQVNLTEIWKDIIRKYTYKSGIDIKKVIFLYSGGKISEEKSIEQIIKSCDKPSKKMNILVKDIERTTKVNDINEERNQLTSKCIICPECGENVKIKIENYKISLYDCKNGHKINDILFNKYEHYQKEASSKIVCNICNNTNMSEDKIYKCLTCTEKNIICAKCTSNHVTNHEIINYELNNYRCSKHKKHKEKFIFSFTLFNILIIVFILLLNSSIVFLICFNFFPISSLVGTFISFNASIL